jgi:hypothetical protein
VELYHPPEKPRANAVKLFKLFCGVSLESFSWGESSLSLNTSSVTAIGNDCSFDVIFARQLEAIGSRGDVVIAIYMSGNPRSVLRAVQTKRKKGIMSVGLTGQRRWGTQEGCGSLHLCAVRGNASAAGSSHPHRPSHRPSPLEVVSDQLCFSASAITFQRTGSRNVPYLDATP